MADGVAHSRVWHRASERIELGTVPVVAVLKGAVIGGGLRPATAAHLRVAEPSTFYALPEGPRGLFVGVGASVRASVTGRRTSSTTRACGARAIGCASRRGARA